MKLLVFFLSNFNCDFCLIYFHEYWQEIKFHSSIHPSTRPHIRPRSQKIPRQLFNGPMSGGEEAEVDPYCAYKQAVDLLYLWCWLEQIIIKDIIYISRHMKSSFQSIPMWSVSGSLRNRRKNSPLNAVSNMQDNHWSLYVGFALRSIVRTVMTLMICAQRQNLVKVSQK